MTTKKKDHTDHTTRMLAQPNLRICIQSEQDQKKANGDVGQNNTRPPSL